MEAKPKTYAIMPLELFSHKDTMYLHARIYKKGKTAEFDPLLAVHRIKKVTMTDTVYEFPNNYNFEKVYNQNFGIIKDKAFKVEAEFTGWAAKYVAERIWSHDQKIKKVGKNKIVLEFTASSEPEVISWLLWFGEETRLTKPEHLINKIICCIDNMKEIYEE